MEYELDGIVTSFLIGEGLRATTDGSFSEEFHTLDEIFNQDYGTIFGISCEIISNLSKCDMVTYASVNDTQIIINFDLKYCPYIYI